MNSHLTNKQNPIRFASHRQSERFLVAVFYFSCACASALCSWLNEDPNPKRESQTRVGGAGKSASPHIPRMLSFKIEYSSFPLWLYNIHTNSLEHSHIHIIRVFCSACALWQRALNVSTYFSCLHPPLYAERPVLYLHHHSRCVYVWLYGSGVDASVLANDDDDWICFPGQGWSECKQCEHNNNRRMDG